jgi:pimeloyl-ACP methyl ester carboxylesterase
VTTLRDERLAGPRTLAATIATPEQPGGLGVLLVHGMGSDRGTNVERAVALADHLGVTALALDLGGHGDSEGRLSHVTPRQNLHDVSVGYDAVSDLPGVQRVAVVGASYGAYLAVLLTASRPVHRLVLRAPALYADGLLDTPLGGRRRGDATSPAVAALGRYPGPVLVVQSEHDEVIPPWVVQAYCASRPGIRHVVLAGARHALTEPAWRQAFTSLVVEFLRDAATAAPA